MGPPRAAPFRGGGIEYLNDLDSYAGGGVMPPGRATQVRQVERSRSDQVAPSFGRDANAGIALIAFPPGGLYVCTCVRWSDGPALCAFLWNGLVGVNPRDPF